MDGMTLRERLEEMLVSPDPIHRRHAEWRLGVLGREAEAAPPSLRPDVQAYHAVTRMLLSCFYRDHHCGCDLPTCHAARGDYDDGRKASRGRCVECLRTTWSIA